MKQIEREDLEVQDISNNTKYFKNWNPDFIKQIDKNGFQIRFPSPYEYLDIKLKSYSQMHSWFDIQVSKYRNWNPPIERIEGKSGDLLLMFFILNNNSIK